MAVIPGTRKREPGISHLEQSEDSLKVFRAATERPGAAKFPCAKNPKFLRIAP